MAVAGGVIVFDVIVNERCLVETFHGDRKPLEAIGNWRIGIGMERLERAYGQERPPAFAITPQPLTRDLLGLRRRGPHQARERFGTEPRINFLADRIQIEPAGFVVAGKVDVFPDPFQIDIGINAIILKQWNRDARNRGGFHVGEGLFKDGETTHADNRFDFAGLNDRGDDRAALGHKHCIAQPLGFFLKILDGAQAALFTQEAELIERGRALGFNAQALGHQEQPPFEGNRRELLAPSFVVDHHGQVITKLLGAANDRNQGISMLAELLHRHRGHGIMLGHVSADQTGQMIALGAGLGNIVLGLALRHQRNSPGKTHNWDLHLHS